MRGVNEAIARTGAQASVTGAGSVFRVHTKAKAPRNYREAYMTAEETRAFKTLLNHLFDEGFLLVNSCSATMSTPMTEADIDALVAAMERGLRKIASA
jgi:glutamate-1-semialdehyde 2,1-aminomutase